MALSPMAGAGTVPAPPDPVGWEASHTGGFLANEGQMEDGSVRYYAGWDRGGVAFVDGGVVLSVADAPALEDLLGPHAGLAGPSRLAGALDVEVRGCSVRLSFEGAGPVTPMGRGMLPGEHNFIRGPDPASWAVGVRSYSEVVYGDLYPGIDLVYLSEGGALKYEFHVRPGADPDTISVRVEGHDGLTADGGELAISTCAGNVVDGGLRVFHQGSPGEPLDASFRLLDDRRYGFSVRGWDGQRTLVIDPYLYSTFLGGVEMDYISSCDVDDEGNAYLTGVAGSGNFPTTAGAFDTSFNLEYDAFVTKLDANGSSAVFSTFLGGSSIEYGAHVFVDDADDVYIVGDTASTDFPVSAGCYQSSSASQYYFDGFVTKLDATGRSLDYSTYLGSDGAEGLTGITVDPSGNAYVVGTTTSFLFPVTSDAYQANNSNDSNWSYEGVVCKLDPNGSRLLYSTYLGGGLDDFPYRVELDDSGAFIVAGQTDSTLFPTTAGAYMTRKPSSNDAGFVTRFKADGSDLLYSTFLGGSAEENLWGLDLDANGNATVVGYTESTDFPTTTGAYQTRHGGDQQDGFVSMLSSDGSSLLYSSFLGGGSNDACTGLAIDGQGKIHVAGGTLSADFPVTAGAVQDKLKGSADAFLAVLSKDMADLEYGTYHGGHSTDQAMDMASVNECSDLFVGFTASNDMTTTAGALQVRYGGDEADGWASLVSVDTVAPLADAGPDVETDQHERVWFNGSNSSDNIGILNWTWTFEYGPEDIALHGSRASFTFHDAGVYQVTLTVLDVSLLSGTDTMNVTVRDITPPVADAGTTRSISQHDTVALDGTGSSDNVGVLNWTWTFEYGGGEVKLHGPSPEFTFHEAGVYNITLEVLDAVGLTDRDWVVVYVLDVTDPVAEAGADVHIEQHETATLDGRACHDNVGVVNWTWTFVHGGEPITLYGEVVDFTFDEAGDITVTLSIRDEGGNRAIDTLVVHVVDVTEPVADAGEDVAVDQGTLVELDGRGSSDNGRIGAYEWTFEYGGVAIELEGSTAEYWFGIPGVYEVTLTVTDREGNSGRDTVTVTVRDTEAPVADAGGPLEVSQGDNVTFDGSASTDNLAVTSWGWTFHYDGEERRLEGAEARWTFDLAGEYEVTLTVRDRADHVDHDVLMVLVRDTEAPSADPGTDRQVDQGTEVQLDGTASTDNVGIANYRWEFTYQGTDVTLNGPTASHGFGLPGSYVITLTVTDKEGNSGTATFTLRVRDTVDPMISMSFDREVKRGQGCRMDASASVDNVGVVSYRWTFDEDGREVVLEGATVEHVFGTPGEHEVTLTIEDAEGNTAEETFTVTVKGSDWLYGAVAAVVVVALVAALLMMRRRGAVPGGGPEGGPGETPGTGPGDAVADAPRGPSEEAARGQGPLTPAAPPTRPARGRSRCT